MTYFEKITDVLENTNLEIDTADEAYLEAEHKLISIISECIKNSSEVSCTAYGNGRVIETAGKTFDGIYLAIDFAGVIKKFSLIHMMTTGKFIKFTDSSEISEVWSAAYDVHTTITNEYVKLRQLKRQMLEEAAKKAEDEKRAEAKYQHLKEKALRDFEALQNRAKANISQVDEFYYALGWLAKHVGSMTATIPEYLQQSFERCFGTEASPRVIDSKKKTVGGYSMQWSFSFKATLCKVETIPAILSQYLSNSGNAITNTSFIWDLIDKYGFCFGKKQVVDEIKKNIPVQYIEDFEAGLIA